MVVDFGHRAETGGAHGLHHQRVDELVGVGRDQREGEQGNAADEQGVALEQGAVGVAQPQGAKDDAEGDERGDLGVVDRQAPGDEAAEGELAPGHVPRGEKDGSGGEEKRDAADLRDELVKCAEAEERAGGEEEKCDERDLAVAALKNRNGSEGEDLEHAEHEDRRHEGLVRLQPGERGDPGDGEFRAGPDLLQAVHEPVMLRVVAALEVGLERQVVVAVVEETLGGQAVVGHVVVAVGDPVEAEADGGPADVEQVNADDAEERGKLPPRKFGAAPDEDADGGDEETEREPRTGDADRHAPDVEARDDHDDQGQSHGGSDEPAPKHAKPGTQKADDCLADESEVEECPKDKEQCDHAVLKIKKLPDSKKAGDKTSPVYGGAGEEFIEPDGGFGWPDCQGRHGARARGERGAREIAEGGEILAKGPHIAPTTPRAFGACRALL